MSNLTSREKEVLVGVAEGLCHKQIAARLFFSVKTVEKHKQTLMNKTGLHCTALLTHFALARGLVKNLFADEPNA